MIVWSQNWRKVGAGARLDKSQLELEQDKILKTNQETYFSIKTCLDMAFWSSLSILMTLNCVFIGPYHKEPGPAPFFEKSLEPEPCQIVRNPDIGFLRISDKLGRSREIVRVENIRLVRLLDLTADFEVKKQTQN